MNAEYPLISIILITYNSSETVIELLESAKAQTYPNIELIISDDCSTDDTIVVCNNWIKVNKNFFNKLILITATKNTGIAPNANRGVIRASGEWIKLIAGDDVLLPSCLQNNYNYINNNIDIKVLFSNIITFKTINGDKVYGHKFPSENKKSLFNTNAEKQFFDLISDRISCPAPSSFIHRKTLVGLGSFDEQFSFYEDFPLWLKFSKNNITLSYFDVDTVLYRQENSITRNDSRWINEKFHYDIKNHFDKKVGFYLKKYNKKKFVIKKLLFIKNDILITIFGNKKTFGSKSFNYIFECFFPGS